MSEPLVKTRRIRITPTQTPPRWIGIVFVCHQCMSENQLEADDVCIPLSPHGDDYLTPACPAPGCGYINLVTLPRPAKETLALLKIGLEPDNEDQVGNPS